MVPKYVPSFTGLLAERFVEQFIMNPVHSGFIVRTVIREIGLIILINIIKYY